MSFFTKKKHYNSTRFERGFGFERFKNKILIHKMLNENKPTFYPFVSGYPVGSFPCGERLRVRHPSLPPLHRSRTHRRSHFHRAAAEAVTIGAHFFIKSIQYSILPFEATSPTTQIAKTDIFLKTASLTMEGHLMICYQGLRDFLFADETHTNLNKNTMIHVLFCALYVCKLLSIRDDHSSVCAVYVRRCVLC